MSRGKQAGARWPSKTQRCQVVVLPLMDRSIQAQQRQPETINERVILGLRLSMFPADSETTAISLTGILYFIIRSRRIHEKLGAELDTAHRFVRPGEPAPWDVALKLSYPDACIMEGLHMHSAARFTSEKYLPSSGAVVAGQKLSGVVVAAVNAWALHHSVNIFGIEPCIHKRE